MGFKEVYETYRGKFPENFKQYYDEAVKNGLAPKYVYAAYKYLMTCKTQSQIKDEFSVSKVTLTKYVKAFRELVNEEGDMELSDFGKGGSSKAYILNDLMEKGIIEEEDVMESRRGLKISGFRKVYEFVDKYFSEG